MVVAPFLERFSAKEAVWLFVRDSTDLEKCEREELATLCKESATVETTYRLVQAFIQMVRHLQGEILET